MSEGNACPEERLPPRAGLLRSAPDLTLVGHDIAGRGNLSGVSESSAASGEVETGERFSVAGSLSAQSLVSVFGSGITGIYLLRARQRAFAAESPVSLSFTFLPS